MTTPSPESKDWEWRHWEPFCLPYLPLLAIEWQGHICSFLLDIKPLWHWGKWKSGPASKRDPRPWQRPTGKYPVCRFEATGQIPYPAVGSNQVGCSCTWQETLSLETNIRVTKEIPTLNPAEEVVFTRLELAILRPPRPKILSRGPPTTCHHCGQTLTIDHMLLERAILRENLAGYYAADLFNTLFETVLETCMVEFLQEVGFFYLIWIIWPSIQFLTWIISKLMQLF